MIDLVRQLNGNLNRMNTANNAALTKLMSGDVTSQDLDKFDDLSNTITGSLDQLMGPLAKMEKAMLGGTLFYIWWWCRCTWASVSVRGSQMSAVQMSAVQMSAVQMISVQRNGAKVSGAQMNGFQMHS